MKIQYCNQNQHLPIPFGNSWLLLFLIALPLSCSAQKSTLSRISTTERSDGKGHVVRIHLQQAASSIDFSQPQPYLIQVELRGKPLDTTNIQLQDDSRIIQNIDYYDLPEGIGLDIFLKPNAFYTAAAYPDRSSNDMLVGLTRTTKSKLAKRLKNMEPFEWSDAPVKDFLSLASKNSDHTSTAIDTAYQKVKNKIEFDTVVLDAGHGGHDVGTHHNGVYEKDIVLAITKKVGEYINKNLPDVDVVYTRDDDTFIKLYERGPIANRAEGDLFVSIHANAASSSRVRGTETYFLGLERSKSALKVMERENQIINPEEVEKNQKPTQEELIIYELANSGYISSSQRLAGMVEQQFKNRANRHSRGVKQARFVVLYQASMPAILIETGFVTNPSEAEYLSSEYGQSIIASAIFRAIRNYKEQFEKSLHLNTQ